MRKVHIHVHSKDRHIPDAGSSLEKVRLAISDLSRLTTVVSGKDGDTIKVALEKLKEVERML